jgi:hypothetical protein
MATKKKAVKKPAAKKAQKRPVEILIAKDGSIPTVTQISIANNGRAYWKSENRKVQWEVYFLCDPFDRAMTTSKTNGRTKAFSLHKRVAAGDQFNYHVVGPLHPRKDEVSVSNLGTIAVED